MPAATNILKATTTSDASPAAPAVPGAEIFAALLSGTETAPAEGATGEEAVSTEVTTEAQPNLDILAPLIAQQQVVPTVTVPNVAGETAPTEGDPATAVIAGSAPISPLVPSEVEGRLNGTSSLQGTETAAIGTNGLDQALADAPRLRSGRAGGEVVPQAAEPAVDGKAVAAAVATGAESVKATDKAGNQPVQSATAPSIATPAQTPANDQQSGSNRQQAETPVPTIEVQAQQPTTSVTDVRSLMASLTTSGIAGASGATQGGPAQQLGEALAAQVLDLAGGSEWLDQLSAEIGRTTDGSGPLRFRLTPESLGELKVEISQSDRGAIVRMTVATEAAQAALADAQPRLAAEARAQGIRIAESQVDLAGNQAQQHQQGRESAREQRATADQPLRAARVPGETLTGTSAPAATSRPAERYA